MMKDEEDELYIDGEKVNPQEYPLIEIWQRILDRMQKKFPGKEIILNTINPTEDKWGDVEVADKIFSGDKI